MDTDDIIDFSSYEKGKEILIKNYQIEFRGVRKEETADNCFACGFPMGNYLKKIIEPEPFERNYVRCEN